MSQQPGPTVGQVSADGQFRWDGLQWTPIPRGEREPTPWTRPMQLAAAGLFAVEAVLAVVFSFIYYSHDAMVRILKAQGTQIPAGMTIDQIADTGRVFAIGFVIFIAILELVAATGSLLRWRWMFWAALVLFAFGAIGAVTTIPSFTNSSSSPYPVGILAVNEVLSIAALAVFVWMLVGAIRYGPWAMKKPGAPA